LPGAKRKGKLFLRGGGRGGGVRCFAAAPREKNVVAYFPSAKVCFVLARGKGKKRTKLRHRVDTPLSRKGRENEEDKGRERRGKAAAPLTSEGKKKLVLISHCQGEKP